MLRLSGFNVFAAAPKAFDTLKRANERFSNKIKGTFIEKTAIYLKNVLIDYGEVAVSVRQDIKNKPVKATFFFTGMGVLAYSMTHNPNEQSFRAKYIQCANEVSMVSPNLVNPEIVKHLMYIQKCYNTNLIRHTSLGFFSIVWIDKFSKECDVYENNCSYLQVPYTKFGSQILDVGFLNIWWVISRRMLDYDINY